VSGEYGIHNTENTDRSEIVECYNCGSKVFKEFVPNWKEVHKRGMIESEYCPICRILKVFKNNNIDGPWCADKVEKIINIIENLKVD